ncbi:ferric reductase-like transmembrane domain-containing protein [Thermomonas brevis]
MKPIRRALWGLLGLSTLLFLLADGALPRGLGWFALRGPVVQYTGVVAIVGMAAEMVLALRSRWLEARLDGLDKMYRLHKWLGIAVLVAAILHWWWALGSKWMVGWGWIVRPARGPRGEPVDALHAWLRGQRGFAEEVGEIAFYGFVVLLAISLWKRIPYHWFARSHRLIPLAWLALAFHTVVLLDYGFWRQPVGWLVALGLLAGTWAALVSLSGRIGAARKVRGTVQAIEAFPPPLDMLKIEVATRPGWRGHQAGQFAFVKSHRHEGAHPYTIASDWHADTGMIRFVTKALGDHTRLLPQQLHEGDAVVIEGPYGRFDFADGKRRQIWVAGGIGITPFLARMQQLEHEPGHDGIDLFYATPADDAPTLARLAALAGSVGVRLHVKISPRDGFLDGAAIRAAVPDWREAGVWFCGPVGFGQALRADLVGNGLDPRDFHQELFQMR